MTTQRKKKAKKLKFELSKAGIGGVAVVVFCLFLWMFLLGVWVGQSLLISVPENTSHISKKAGQAKGIVELKAAHGMKKKILTK